MNTSKLQNTPSTVRTANVSNQPAVAQQADGDALPLSETNQEGAAKFERTTAKSSLFAPSARAGGDSRVVLPAGGGTGEINNQQAIDAHSKKSGDFSEPRTVDGKQLFFTPAGARAIDVAFGLAQESGAPMHAENDPTFWERFFKGDAFAGNELHTGKK